MKFINNFTIGVFLLLPYQMAFSNPDISFIDSRSKYNDSYLRHELEGNRIRFVIEGNIDNIQMPTTLFPIEDLKNFIRNYRPLFPALREEFIDMLQQSMYSRYRAKTFLLALLRVLRHYNLSCGRVLGE